MASKNPFECYDVRYLLEALGVAVVIVVLAWFARGEERGSPARIAVAVLQGAAFGYLIVRTLLSLRKLDEMQQRIHLVAIAISFGASAVLVTAAGFLEKAGVPLPRPGLWIWALMALVWGGGVMVLFRRYR